jgi:hypothetical protein
MDKAKSHTVAENNLEKEEADALKRAGDLNDPRNVFVSDIDGGAYTEDGVEGADDAIPLDEDNDDEDNLDDAEPEFDEDAEENKTEEKQSEDRHLEQEAKRKCLEEDDYMVVIHERKSRVKGQMLEQADDYVIVNHERKSRVKGQMLEQADDYVEVNHEEEDILNNGGDDVEVEVGDANVAMDKAKSHTVDETTTPTEEEDNDNVPHWSLQVFTNPEKANHKCKSRVKGRMLEANDYVEVSHERKSRVKGQMLDFVGLTDRGSVFCCGSQMTSLPSSARSEELQDEGADDLNDLRKVSLSGILNKGADDFNDHRTGANDFNDHRTVFDSGTLHEGAGDLNDPRNAFVPDIGNDSDEELHDEADQRAAVTAHQFLLETITFKETMPGMGPTDRTPPQERVGKGTSRGPTDRKPLDTHGEDKGAGPTDRKLLDTHGGDKGADGFNQERMILMISAQFLLETTGRIISMITAHQFLLETINLLKEKMETMPTPTQERVGKGISQIMWGMGPTDRQLSPIRHRHLGASQKPNMYAFLDRQLTPIRRRHLGASQMPNTYAFLVPVRTKYGYG